MRGTTETTVPTSGHITEIISIDFPHLERPDARFNLPPPLYQTAGFSFFDGYPLLSSFYHFIHHERQKYPQHCHHRPR